ncbi:MAG: alpha-galactosidase [Terracidiphilus sp.]
MGNSGRKTMSLTALAFIAALAAIFLCGSASLRAQSTPKQIAVPLPPMGWSSWNSFSNTVDSQVIVDQAKAMIATGLHKAGYQYVNIDEGWWLGRRDAEGNIVVDPRAWPALAAGERAGDMSNIVRYIHGLGLKAGIYTDAGRNGCGTFYPDIGPGYPNEGSEGHYEQDFLEFARWGFDYVKVDWCGGDKENLDPAVQYDEIARAIARAEAMTGHRLYFSICEWGKQSPWTWAPGTGGVRADIWRTSGDIVAPIVAGSKSSGRRASFERMLSNFDQGIHPEAQHTGFYNDPDMMVLGMPGLTEAQDRVHMSLWAMSGAPLLIGADLTKLTDADLAMLSNHGAIAVDQDALGLQAVKVAEPATGLEVWSKRLAPAGERAVLLLNRTAAAARISVDWSELGLAGSSAEVKDLWSGKDNGRFDRTYAAPVAAGDAVLLLVRGTEGKMTHYEAAGAAVTPVRGFAALAKDQPLSFTGVASRARMAAIEVVYTNPDKSPRFAQLRTNGQDATRIAFPSTGGAEGAIWIQASLDRAGAANVLTFSAVCATGPAIKSISAQ